MRAIYETRLARAATEQEVVGIVRDYVSCWLPEDLGRIPRRVLPGKIRDAEDIADCAIELTLERIGQSNPNFLLIEMEAFFAHACARVSKLEMAAFARAAADAAWNERESAASAGE